MSVEIWQWRYDSLDMIVEILYGSGNMALEILYGSGDTTWQWRYYMAVEIWE